MAYTTEQFSQQFAKKWGATMDTSMRNYADRIAVNMKKLAPYASGDLMRSITVTKRYGTGRLTYEIVSDRPYAIVRNKVNNLHPQTKHYIERGISIAKAGGHTQWWKSLD